MRIRKNIKKGKRDHKDERLQQIVITAASLFFKNGYSQTTTRQIADACGISQGNLYYYIKSKEGFFDLFVKMTTDSFRTYDREISRRLKRISYTSALKMKIRESLLALDDIQDMILFWYRESGNMSHKQIDRVIEMELGAIVLLTKIIEGGCKKGEFAVDDAALAAYQITMLQHMWCLKRWHLRSRYTLEEYINNVQQTALGILHTGESSLSPSKLKGKTANRRIKSAK
ncbi:MAG: TetR/AcrR family transcriptional regulator [Dehalococcoidia bacterium]|nr:TetR/AcrR family transcriptional regulator [Dehalococcoidia bacterium]